MKNSIKLICIIMSTVLLTGCWDNVELNERHIVLELAIDRDGSQKEAASGDGSAEERKNYVITYAVPDIAKLSGNESLSENIKTTFRVEAPTLFKSVEEVQQKTQNTITFSHTKAILFGEELMKDRDLFRTAVDSLVRNNEISRGVYMLAVKGKAEDITKAENYQNPIVGLYVMKHFNNRERGTGYTRQQLLGDMVKEMEETNIAIMPQISNNKEESTFEIEGAAVIRDYSLIGWLSKEEVRGKNFVDSEIKDIPIVIENEGEYLSYQLKRENCRILFKDQAGNLRVNLLIETEGDIAEYISNKEKYVFDEGHLAQINDLIEKEIEREVDVAIKKSREINTDFLGIGLQLYRTQPRLWEKYKYIWENGEYNKLSIQVDAQNDIRSTGILQ